MPMITHDGTNFSQTPTAGDTWEHEGIRRTLNTNGAWKESETVLADFSNVSAANFPADVITALRGPQGDAGTNGTNGTNGADSTVAGPQGDAGVAGPQGDAGIAGSSPAFNLVGTTLYITT